MPLVKTTSASPVLDGLQGDAWGLGAEREGQAEGQALLGALWIWAETGTRGRGETQMDGRGAQRLGERTEHKQMKRKWRTRLWRKSKSAWCENEKKKKKGNQNGEVWREESKRQIKSEALLQSSLHLGLKESKHTRIDSGTTVTAFIFASPNTKTLCSPVQWIVSIQVCF